MAIKGELLRLFPEVSPKFLIEKLWYGIIGLPM